MVGPEAPAIVVVVTVLAVTPETYEVVNVPDSV